jgi:predicted RNA binding protein YcfA (HicA-like mRNA interferase family)
MNGYYRLIIEALRLKGFCLLRAGKGSHEIWHNGKVRVSVPFNCPSKHTANAVLVQAGLGKKF